MSIQTFKFYSDCKLSNTSAEVLQLSDNSDQILYYRDNYGNKN